MTKITVNVFARTFYIIYCNQYYFRLAEACLIRAEAYVNTGKNSEAAADINVLRNRSQAKNVTSEQMSIDFNLANKDGVSFQKEKK